MLSSDPDVLPQAFFARDPAAVAADLVGCTCISLCGGKTVISRVVETEAYRGHDDPASHAYRGPTDRTAVMFGAPGHAYVYRSYGVHWCCNVVAHGDDGAGAVLFRSAEVVGGEEHVRARLGCRPERPQSGLLRGPGLFARGLGITVEDNGLPYFADGSHLQLRKGEVGERERIICTPRIGISVAAEAPLRFCIAAHPAVSGPSRLRR